MSDRGVVELDPLVFAEVFELFGGEIFQLSVMMLCWKVMDLMKLTALFAAAFVIGTASIHFVNLSTAANR